MVWPFTRNDPSAYLPGPAAPPPADAPPAYVPMERFNQALEEVRGMNSKLDQFTGLMTGFLGTSTSGPASRVDGTPPQEVPIDDVSDEDYADAVLKGDAARISKRTKAEVERSERKLRKEYDQRFKTLENQGMGILDQVNTELGQQAMGGMPYYQILKADIDAQLKTIPAHQRTAEMRQWVYDRTVGANLPKIRAHDQAEEERIRQERTAVDMPGRDRGGKDSKPSAATVFGEEVLNPTRTWHGGGPLWDRRTPDEWARMRYGTKDMNEAAVVATNILAISDCHKCFGPIINGRCHCRKVGG